MKRELSPKGFGRFETEAELVFRRRDQVVNVAEAVFSLGKDRIEPSWGDLESEVPVLVCLHGSRLDFCGVEGDAPIGGDDPVKDLDFGSLDGIAVLNDRSRDREGCHILRRSPRSLGGEAGQKEWEACKHMKIPSEAEAQGLNPYKRAS